MESVLYDTAKETSVKYNIIHGRIEYIARKPLGILYVNIIGDQQKRITAEQLLRERTADVEVIYSV